MIILILPCLFLETFPHFSMLEQSAFIHFCHCNQNYVMQAFSKNKVGNTKNEGLIR